MIYKYQSFYKTLESIEKVSRMSRAQSEKKKSNDYSRNVEINTESLRGALSWIASYSKSALEEYKPSK